MKKGKIMVELNGERIDQMLHNETPQTEELTTILRCVYTRYMLLYENYFKDIDALNEDKLAELRKHYEETRSLIKYYYLDIPFDIDDQLSKFDDENTSKLLGEGWHKYLFDSYSNYKSENEEEDISEEYLKAQFTEEILKGFYEEMDSIFRSGFGTESVETQQVVKGIKSILFGKD